MHVTMIHLHIKPEYIDDFLQAIRLNHEGSVREPGNLRFDVLQLAEEPERFLVYEIFRDEAAARAHKESEHFRAWKEKSGNWMASPRVAVPCEGLFIGH
ncbi:MAG: antibiotic biosynthesis monooxygenase [Gammaproteobacteria bacterium]|jgi:autoinducer 2-degrading protein|nr:antibiotic biosynthesis monooxygenase [Gammaproteobacteria bacterium]